MALINHQFLKIVNDKVQNRMDRNIYQFLALNRDAKLIRLDSGDVIRPLAPCVMEAMTEAIAEMGDETTFKGRGQVAGYPFRGEMVSVCWRRFRPPFCRICNSAG